MSPGFISKLHALLLIVLGVLTGVLCAVFYFYSKNVASTDCIQKFALTSPLLDCSSYEDSASRLSALDTQLNTATVLYIQQGRATRMSVWVRDQKTFQWAASNEYERYAPASLLKLPLMVAYFKIAEIQPSILDAQVIYTRSTELNDSTQDFAPPKTLVEGQSYAVSQLIEYMMVYSDNNAAAALLGRLDPALFENTLVELGIKVPGSASNYDFVTVKTYGNIFRVLYNASYLNRTYSEKALEIMASSSFKGIAEPLPLDTVVAHKFGEREVNTPDGKLVTREFHDCGLIYKGARTYSLCIMTEGKDFAALSGIVKDISKLVYEKL